jgi:C1A family cysteine protease
MTLKFTFAALSLLIVTTLAIEQLSKDAEQKIINDYFNSRTTRSGRASRTTDHEQNVIKRYYEVQRHNERFRQGIEDYEQTLNDFSELSDDEFAATRLGYNPPEKEVIDSDSLVPVIDAGSRAGRSSEPEYWNWAEQGSVVQPVQNQGSCGSCYAFAAAGALESSMCRYYGQCVKLSEQEMMDCTNGCAGGWDHWVYNYTTVYGGSTLKSSYGYYGYARTCSPGSRARQANSAVYSQKVLPNDEPTIRSFLYRYGPMFTAFYVYSNFNSYSSGVITTTTGNVLGGHAVLLVGYGTTSGGVPYWIGEEFFENYF